MAKIKKYGQSAVSGKDIRLKKKIKPVNQGGGPNFLGKVETVTVPKQWLSSPDHVVAELAYITPAEQKMLIEADLYGSLNGKPNRGPAGLLSLQGDMGPGGGGNYGGGGSEGENEGRDSNRGSDSSRDSNENYDTISRAAAKDYGVSSPTKEQIEAARGFDFGSDASDALVAQITGGYGGSMLGDKYAGSGFENQMFFDQLPDRLANAATLPGLLGVGSTYMLNKMKNQVLAGGIPAFSAAVPRGGLTGYGDRKFRGVFSKGPFGFDVYTGMPIEGNELTGWSPDDFSGGPEPEIKPVNPETGQCDEGYMFDEDLQACRLDTGFASGGQPGGFAPESGAYARMGLLDEAPTGLPEFQQRYGAGFGTPSEFADANLAFRRQGAYRPEYFDQPYPTTGYTLLS